MFTGSPFAAEAESKAAAAREAEQKLKTAQVKTTLAVDTTVNDGMQAKAASGNTPVSPTPNENTSVDDSFLNGPHGRGSHASGFYAPQKTDSKQSDNGTRLLMHV